MDEYFTNTRYGSELAHVPAAVLSLASAAVSMDESIEAVERQKRSTKFASDSIGELRAMVDAVAKRDPNYLPDLLYRLEHAPYFAPVRQQADFQSLVKTLKEQLGKRGE
jgi:hypothetical protein